MKEQKREVEAEQKQCQNRLAQLSAEISKSLSGDSAFTPDMLSMAIEDAKVKLQATEDKLAELNYGLKNSQGAMKKLDVYYEQFLAQ